MTAHISSGEVSRLHPFLGASAYGYQSG